MQQPDPRHLVRPLVAAVAALDDAARALDQRVRTSFGVNNMDYAALQFIDRATRRGELVRVGDLAARFGVSSGSATEIVHRLTDAGLVRRAAHSGDARVRRIELTPAAVARMAEAMGELRRELERLIDAIPPEEEARLLDLVAAVQEIVARPRGT